MEVSEAGINYSLKVLFMRNNIDQEYVTPSVDVFEVLPEGFLCLSAWIDDWDDEDEDYGGVIGF